MHTVILMISVGLAGNSLFSDTDSPKIIFDYAHEFGIGMNVNAPRHALGVEEVERWGRMLDLSEAQLLFVHSEYQQFVERHNEFLDREAPRYLALTVELREISRAEGISSPRFARMTKEVDQASINLRHKLSSLEQSLIASIKPVLTKEQAERLGILTHETTRRNCRTYYGVARWSDVELGNIWDESAAALASPLERQLVLPMFAEYGARLTNLVCRRADVDFEVRERLMDNRVAREDGRVTPAEARDRYRQIMNLRLDAAQQIRSLHEETVTRVAQTVSDDVGSVFIAAAKQAAFPELYPDNAALHDLLAALTDDDELDDENGVAVRGLAQQYIVQHEQLCKQMERKCITWGDNTAAGISGYEPQFLPDALQPLLDERTRLSCSYLQQLLGLLDQDVLDRHADAIPAPFRSILAENDQAEEIGEDIAR